MGMYIDKGNRKFAQALNSTYVDKSGLIAVINRTLFTEQRRSCVTRSRRFGKSMAANMLCAYYDRSCDSRSLFENLEIAQDPSFEKYLNKFPVIKLDITDFVTRYKDDPGIIDKIQEALIADVRKAYPNVVPGDFDGDFMDMLSLINQETGDSFIMVIDEWDTMCRESRDETVTAYLNWMRCLFKSGHTMRVFAGIYMTGILPIKRYSKQSALNNFVEYSVTSPMGEERFFGFTSEEVKRLCAEKGMDYDDLAKWYDGYSIGSEPSIFNPNSVILALFAGRCDSFWSKTASYELVNTYIEMNFEGMKDDIIHMLAGGRCRVNTKDFSNDMRDVRSKDEALTVLIHLGYLAYDYEEEECYIPNYEVRREMESAVRDTGWQIAHAISNSKRLLQETLAGNSDYVAEIIDRAHDENTSVLSYNNENSLACVLTLAYIYATTNYIIHREFASGKGFADLVFIPRKNVAKPAIVAELKYNADAEAAIAQIKNKKYMSRIEQYTGEIVLVGISYDKKEKRHSCVIESVTK